MRRYASPFIYSIAEKIQRSLIKFDVYIKKLWREGGSILFCYTSLYTLAVQSTSVGMLVSVSQHGCDRQLDNLIPFRSFATKVSQLKMGDFSGEKFKVLKCFNFL